MNEYDKQAADFLAETASTIDIKFKEYGKHFAEDKEKRDIYAVTLARGTRKYEFNFGQSLNNSGIKIALKTQPAYHKAVIPTEHYHAWKALKRKLSLKYYINTRDLAPYRLEACDVVHPPIPPTAYCILACLTTHDPEDFKWFCDCYGYDTDSRRALKTFKAVVKEYEHLAMLYNDNEMEKLGEIN